MLYPKATKTSMIKLLRAMGQDIPNSRSAAFTSLKRSFWLHWDDSKGVRHTAYYTGSAGKPVLQIDRSWLRLTLADAIRNGMVEHVREKENPV